MKKTIILLIALMVISIGVLSGCNEQRVQGEDIDIEENIKGEWIATRGETIYSFIFYNDGKTFRHGVGAYFIMGDYYIVGDRLEYYQEAEGYAPSFQNYYVIEMPDKDTLILTTIGEGTFTHDGELEYTRMN